MCFVDAACLIVLIKQVQGDDGQFKPINPSSQPHPQKNVSVFTSWHLLPAKLPGKDKKNFGEYFLSHNLFQTYITRKPLIKECAICITTHFNLLNFARRKNYNRYSKLLHKKTLSVSSIIIFVMNFKHLRVR